MEKKGVVLEKVRVPLCFSRGGGSPCHVWNANPKNERSHQYYSFLFRLINWGYLLHPPHEKQMRREDIFSSHAAINKTTPVYDSPTCPCSASLRQVHLSESFFVLDTKYLSWIALSTFSTWLRIAFSIADVLGVCATQTVSNINHDTRRIDSVSAYLPLIRRNDQIERVFPETTMSLSANSAKHLVGGLVGKDLALLCSCSAAHPPMNGWVGKMYSSLASSIS